MDDSFDKKSCTRFVGPPPQFYSFAQFVFFFWLFLFTFWIEKQKLLKNLSEKYIYWRQRTFLLPFFFTLIHHHHHHHVIIWKIQNSKKIERKKDWSELRSLLYGNKNGESMYWGKWTCICTCCLIPAHIILFTRTLTTTTIDRYDDCIFSIMSVLLYGLLYYFYNQQQ